MSYSTTRTTSRQVNSSSQTVKVFQEPEQRLGSDNVFAAPFRAKYIGRNVVLISPNTRAGTTSILHGTYYGPSIVSQPFRSTLSDKALFTTPVLVTNNDVDKAEEQPIDDAWRTAFDALEPLQYVHQSTGDVAFGFSQDQLSHLLPQVTAAEYYDPDQLIALLADSLRHVRAQVAAQQTELHDLRNRVANLEAAVFPPST